MRPFQADLPAGADLQCRNNRLTTAGVRGDKAARLANGGLGLNLALAVLIRLRDRLLGATRSGLSCSSCPALRAELSGAFARFIGKLLEQSCRWGARACSWPDSTSTRPGWIGWRFAGKAACSCQAEAGSLARNGSTASQLASPASQVQRDAKTIEPASWEFRARWRRETCSGGLSRFSPAAAGSPTVRHALSGFGCMRETIPALGPIGGKPDPERSRARWTVRRSRG